MEPTHDDSQASDRTHRGTLVLIILSMATVMSATGAAVHTVTSLALENKYLGTIQALERENSKLRSTCGKSHNILAAPPP